ncbi:MAG: GyrI-like domain-containing protein [Bombilactobacillus sp.]|nr:GyrI-like domain-containing protein [Bombilactobacillus sp.]
MKKLQKKVTFVGRPFPDQLMDEQKTFNQSNMEMEQNQVFQDFIAKNDLTNTRSNMVVFGPENFMYWYGVIAPNKVEVPKGLMKFVLPEAQVAITEKDNQNISFFSQPLNMVISQFLAAVADEGIKIYQNPGDSLTPYVVQTLNFATKKLTQELYLEDSH